MEDQRDRTEIFKVLKKIKSMDNFNWSLMSREEKVDYLVYQMEQVEKKLPEAVEYVEYGFDMNRY